MPSSLPRRRVPAWACRSVGGLSSHTEALCGRVLIRDVARHFNSHYLLTWRRPPHRPRKLSYCVAYLEAVASSAQAQTAFFSFSVSLASGCIAVYCHGGILPVNISPHMDSNLSCLCHCE